MSAGFVDRQARQAARPPPCRKSGPSCDIHRLPELADPGGCRDIDLPCNNLPLLRFRIGLPQVAATDSRYNAEVRRYKEDLTRYKEALTCYKEALRRYKEEKCRYEDRVSRYESLHCCYKEALPESGEELRRYKEGLSCYNEGLPSTAEHERCRPGTTRGDVRDILLRARFVQVRMPRTLGWVASAPPGVVHTS